VPHELGTVPPPGMTGPVGAAGLAGAAGPTGASAHAHGSCLIQSTSFPAGTTWMNEIDRGYVGLIEWMRL
jgi:hypothetical protein